LIRFKVQTAFAEIKHLAGMYNAFNGDIVEYERFIFIASVFPALSVYFQICLPSFYWLGHLLYGFINRNL